MPFDVYPPGLIGVGTGVAVSAGTNLSSSGTVVFSNSNGVTFGMSNNGVITASVVAGGGGGIANAAGTQTATSGTVVFSNSNNITFGMSNSSVVTASFSQSNQTVASGGIAATGFTTTTIAGSTIGGTHDTAGLKLAVPAYITTFAAQTNQTVASGNIAGTGFSSTTTAGTAIVGTNNTAGLSLGVPLYLTTQTVQTQASGAIAGSGFTSTTTVGVVPVATHNSAGLSMGVPNWITTYAAQTVQPVAFSASGGSSAFSTLNFANSNGLTFSNSNGSVIGSYTVPATAGLISGTFSAYAVGNTTQSSSGTIPYSSLQFNGAGIASVGVSGGSVVISVPAGGGGGDGYNIVSMLTATSGGGTLGATFSTLSGSIGLMAGSNITLSQTSNTIVINGPSGGAQPTLSDWEPIPLGASTTQVLGQNTVYFQPLYPVANISFSAIEVLSNISISSSAIAGWTKGSTIQYGLYAQDTGTNATRITLLSSSSFAVNMTANSNASFMVSLSQGANSTTYSTAASIHSAVNGTKIVSLPFAGTISAGGNYFFGMVQSTSTAGANVASTVGMVFNNEYVASFGVLAPNTLGASSASIVHEPFGFIYATTSGALPGTVPNTAWSVTNNQQPYLFFEA